MRKVLGDVHTEWGVSSFADLTVEAMLEQTRHIAADSSAAGFSIAKMKADYEAMIASSSAAAGKPVKIDLLAATGRKTCGAGWGGVCVAAGDGCAVAASVVVLRCSSAANHS